MIKIKIHYVYICRKKVGANAVCQERFAAVMTDLENQEKLEEEFGHDENPEEDNAECDNNEHDLNLEDDEPESHSRGESSI